MQTRHMTCIRCPMGCRMTATLEDGRVTIVGNACKRGAEYGKQEMLCPMRTVTSNVRVAGGARPLCSVKTAGDVPKSAIPEVLAAIHTAQVAAPVAIGQTIIDDVAGTGIRLVATSNIPA